MEKKIKNLLTAPNIAEMCECDLKTVHNWVTNGYIKHFRTPGGHLRFIRNDVISFMKEKGYPVPDDLLKTKETKISEKPIKKKKKIKKNK